MVVGGVIGAIVNAYNSLLAGIPSQYSDLVVVFVFALLIVIYSIFTWKFYRFLSKKDLISLNLIKYNHLKHPFLNKLWAIILYLIEYIIILPFLIFFWFGVLALLILVLSENLAINQVIIVSAAMVAAIRMLSYYEEDLSRDLAKMFPFTILAIFILNPNFFSLERILTNLVKIPEFVGSILFFLILIVVIEVILRIIDVIRNAFTSGREGKQEKEIIMYHPEPSELVKS
jgi:hypothetical protein